MPIDWKGVLEEIVSDSPNAFNEGRQILDSTIKGRQADIFLIATDREDRVENYIKYGNCHFKWNPIFIWMVHDCEIESMAHLLEDIYIYIYIMIYVLKK